MEAKDIDRLLERYWQCETSCEEEQELRSFFSGDSVPENLKAYRSLFVWKIKQSEIKAEKQLKTRMQKPVSVQFYHWIRVAASVLLLLSVGIGFYTHYEQQEYMEKVFSETYTDPEEAMKETQEALGIVSLSLMKAQDLFNQEDTTDSVQDQNAKEKEIEDEN